MQNSRHYIYVDLHRNRSITRTSPRHSPSLAQMVAYLLSFHQDRDDEQFADEKQYLIKQIRELQ